MYSSTYLIQNKLATQTLLFISGRNTNQCQVFHILDSALTAKTVHKGTVCFGTLSGTKMLTQLYQFCLGRVNFLHSSSYSALFWSCDNSIDNTPMFQLLLNSAYAPSSPFLFLLLLLPGKLAGIAQDVGRGYN